MYLALSLISSTPQSRGARHAPGSVSHRPRDCRRLSRVLPLWGARSSCGYPCRRDQQNPRFRVRLSVLVPSVAREIPLHLSRIAPLTLHGPERPVLNASQSSLSSRIWPHQANVADQPRGARRRLDLLVGRPSSGRTRLCQTRGLRFAWITPMTEMFRSPSTKNTP